MVMVINGDIVYLRLTYIKLHMGFNYDYGEGAQLLTRLTGRLTLVSGGWKLVSVTLWLVGRYYLNPGDTYQQFSIGFIPEQLCEETGKPLPHLHSFW